MTLIFLSVKTELKGLEDMAKEWDITQAKDGDIVADTDWEYPFVGIFQNLNDDGTFNVYCYMQRGKNPEFGIQPLMKVGAFALPDGEALTAKYGPLTAPTKEDVL